MIAITKSLGILTSNLFDAYDIAAHSVRVRKSGTILDIHSLWDIESMTENIVKSLPQLIYLQLPHLFRQRYLWTSSTFSNFSWTGH